MSVSASERYYHEDNGALLRVRWRAPIHNFKKKQASAKRKTTLLQLNVFEIEHAGHHFEAAAQVGIEIIALR